MGNLSKNNKFKGFKNIFNSSKKSNVSNASSNSKNSKNSNTTTNDLGNSQVLNIKNIENKDKENNVKDENEKNDVEVKNVEENKTTGNEQESIELKEKRNETKEVEDTKENNNDDIKKKENSDNTENIEKEKVERNNNQNKSIEKNEKENFDELKKLKDIYLMSFLHQECIEILNEKANDLTTEYNNNQYLYSEKRKKFEENKTNENRKRETEALIILQKCIDEREKIDKYRKYYLFHHNEILPSILKDLLKRKVTLKENEIIIETPYEIVNNVTKILYALLDEDEKLQNSINNQRKLFRDVYNNVVMIEKDGSKSEMSFETENEKDVLYREYYTNTSKKQIEVYPPSTIKKVYIINNLSDVKKFLSEDAVLNEFMSESHYTTITRRLKQNKSILYGYYDVMEIEPENIYRLKDDLKTYDNRLKCYFLFNNLLGKLNVYDDEDYMIEDEENDKVNIENKNIENEESEKDNSNISNNSSNNSINENNKSSNNENKPLVLDLSMNNIENNELVENVLQINISYANQMKDYEYLRMTGEVPETESKLHYINNSNVLNDSLENSQNISNDISSNVSNNESIEENSQTVQNNQDNQNNQMETDDSNDLNSFNDEDTFENYSNNVENLKNEINDNENKKINDIEDNVENDNSLKINEDIEAIEENETFENIEDENTEENNLVATNEVKKNNVDNIDVNNENIENNENAEETEKEEVQSDFEDDIYQHENLYGYEEEGKQVHIITRQETTNDISLQENLQDDVNNQIDEDNEDDEENLDISNVNTISVQPTVSKIVRRKEVIYIEKQVLFKINPRLYCVTSKVNENIIIGVEAKDFHDYGTGGWIEIKDNYYNLFKIMKRQKTSYSGINRKATIDVLKENFEIIKIEQ